MGKYRAERKDVLVKVFRLEALCSVPHVSGSKNVEKVVFYAFFLNGSKHRKVLEKTVSTTYWASLHDES